MPELHFADLVVGRNGRGTRFVAGGIDPATGVDCKGLVLVVLRRLGRHVPEHALLGASDVCGSGRSATAFANYMHEQGSSWDDVTTDALALGDVLVVETPERTHLGIVVDTERARALHVTPRNGVHAVPCAILCATRRLRLRSTP